MQALIDLKNIDQNVYNEIIFVDPENPTRQLKRTGFCNRCGQCCIDTKNLFQTHDGNGNPIDEPLKQEVPGMCAYFRWREDGLGECTGRNTQYYLNGCALWPSIPEHTENYDKCGYKYEWITE